MHSIKFMIRVRLSGEILCLLLNQNLDRLGSIKIILKAHMKITSKMPKDKVRNGICHYSDLTQRAFAKTLK